MAAQRHGADEGHVSRSSARASAGIRHDEGQAEASPRKLTAREGSLLSGVRRRTVISVTAAAAVLAMGAVAVNHFTTSGNAASRVVNGTTVEYTAGHQPLVPNITATSLTGSPIKMTSYRGKILVLNFWWSACAPCVAEAPTLEVAYKEYHSQGVDFLGDDVGDNVTNALSFVHNEGISYPSMNDPSYSVLQEFSQTIPVSATPATAVIDKTGHVVGISLGRIGIGELTALIQQAGAADS